MPGIFTFEDININLHMLNEILKKQQHKYIYRGIVLWFYNKYIGIIGGTGTIGSIIVKYLLQLQTHFHVLIGGRRSIKRNIYVYIL